VFLVEKASSLMEAEENLEQGSGENVASHDRTAVEGDVGDLDPHELDDGELERRARPRDVREGSSSSSGPVGGGSLGSSPVGGGRGSRSEGSGMHARPRKPVESGVFSGLSSEAASSHVSGDQLVESLQHALSAASRSEAGLGSLHRSVRDASRALTASRHAHESLSEELRVMYRGLNDVMSEKAAVERYAALLTQERDAALDAAEDARREAKREREFLLREQDRFIQLLLEEHEAELQQLRRGLALRPPEGAAVSERSAVSERVLSGAAGSDEGAARPVSGLAVQNTSGSGGLTPPPVLVRAPDAEDGVLRFFGEEYAEKERLVVDEAVRDAEPRVSGAALARLALANSSGEGGSGERQRPSLPGTPEVSPAERAMLENVGLDGRFTDRAQLQGRGEEPSSGQDAQKGERPPTYPPPPAVLDLDSLAAEVDGNSERPPPIRRVGGEPKIHLRPARVPSQLFEALRSKTDDPKRKP
jgi:hypothetical protein